LIKVAAQAISETVTILGTGLVIYLSVNAVTHPATLTLRAIHISSWPTEGALRVIALSLCVCSVSVLRFLRADPAASSTITQRSVGRQRTEL
jgi:hypothetical protein